MTTTSARKSLLAIKVRDAKKEMKPHKSRTTWARASGLITSREGSSRAERCDAIATTITGLTSNPSIFDHAIKNSNYYDEAIGQKRNEGKSAEGLFFELAL